MKGYLKIMPKRHAYSHAFAGMFSTILGGILIRIISDQVLGIDLTKYFEIILNYLPIKDYITPEIFTNAFFVFGLCFVWGMLFYYFHER